MKIYLDDERQTPVGWKRTYGVKETIDLLKTGKVTQISLDHDLGKEDENGYQVLLWIEEQVFLHGFKAPEMMVHSANASARIKMEAAIEAIERKMTGR